MSGVDSTAAKIWRDALDAASECGIVFRPAANRRGEAVITAVLAQARNAALEEAARACDEQWQAFLSPEYATGQPLSSFQERFACGMCATAIRTLSTQDTPDMRATNKGDE